MKRPIVLAHRGYSRKYPENSLLAFDKALESGADGIECDIQKTKDDCFVIIHDAETGRVAGKPGLIQALNSEELRQYNLSQDQKIPFLREIFQSLPADSMINLEIKKETVKTTDIPSLIQEIKSCHPSQNLLVSSFQGSLLSRFKKEGFQTGLLFGSTRLLGNFQSFIWLLQVNPDYVNLPAQLASISLFSAKSIIPSLLKKLGKKIAYWNIRTNEDLIHCLPTADILIGDDPPELLRWLQEIIPVE